MPNPHLKETAGLLNPSGGHKLPGIGRELLMARRPARPPEPPPGPRPPRAPRGPRGHPPLRPGTAAQGLAAPRPNGTSRWSCGCERPKPGRAARGAGGAGAAPAARARGGGAGAVAVAPVRHSRPRRHRARRWSLRARCRPPSRADRARIVRTERKICPYRTNNAFRKDAAISPARPWRVRKNGSRGSRGALPSRTGPFGGAHPPGSDSITGRPANGIRVRAVQTIGQTGSRADVPLVGKRRRRTGRMRNTIFRKRHPPPSRPPRSPFRSPVLRHCATPAPRTPWPSARGGPFPVGRAPPRTGFLAPAVPRPAFPPGRAPGRDASRGSRSRLGPGNATGRPARSR